MTPTSAPGCSANVQMPLPSAGGSKTQQVGKEPRVHKGAMNGYQTGTQTLTNTKLNGIWVLETSCYAVLVTNDQ